MHMFMCLEFVYFVSVKVLGALGLWDCEFVFVTNFVYLCEAWLSVIVIYIIDNEFWLAFPTNVDMESIEPR